MKIFRKLQNPFFNQRLVFNEIPGKAGVEAAKTKEKPAKPELEARSKLADAPADEVTGVDTPDKQNRAGKIHQNYLEKIKTAPEESTEKDRKKLEASNIEDIRFNSRLLKKRDEKEDDPTQAAGIKEETQRRIKAYTSNFDEGWYTLNYQRMGYDKKGLSHENNVGLGDILLDPDIQDILIKKNDESLIKAHRGIVPKGQQYGGRLGYMDNNNKYVATFTNDQFRILSENETNIKDTQAVGKYVKQLKEDDATRDANRESFEQEIMLDGSNPLNFNKEKGNKSQPLNDADIIQKLNSKRAEKDGQNIFDYAQECCKKFNIPWSIFKELIQIESGWSPEVAYKGPVNSDASGLGQFLSSTWKGFMQYCTTNNIRDEKWGKTMDADTRFNPYASLYATAWLMSKTREAFPDFDKKNVAEQGLIYYVCHHEGVAGGKNFLKQTANGNCPKRDVLALANRIAYRASVTEGFDISTIQQEEIAFRIDDGKEGYNGKGILKLRSNQDTWIFGSSGAVAMNALNRKLKLDNTGFFGIVGISPKEFLNKLTEIWPKIAQLKLPKQVVLVGMGANNPDLDSYAHIKQFLEDKGVKVKIATVQPAKGVGEQISRFNDKLREKYQSDTLIDITKCTTTPDGKHINPEYASADGIHLNNKGYQKMAELIKESADKKKTA